MIVLNCSYYGPNLIAWTDENGGACSGTTNDPRIAAMLAAYIAEGNKVPAYVQPQPTPSPSILDAPTLAAVLITKGVIAQLDLDTAVANAVGIPVAQALATVTVSANPLPAQAQSL